jgi:hypothetical protein
MVSKAPVGDQASTLSRKNRLLAKAQSEWMLSTLKEENPNARCQCHETFFSLSVTKTGKS